LSEERIAHAGRLADDLGTRAKSIAKLMDDGGRDSDVSTSAEAGDPPCGSGTSRSPWDTVDSHHHWQADKPTGESEDGSLVRITVYMDVPRPTVPRGENHPKSHLSRKDRGVQD
jgi:hypothetical protein